MKSRDYSKYGNNLSFIDMLFAMLLGVFALFVLSTMIMGSPQQPQKKVDEKVDLMITMMWDDNSPNDIDLWVLNPYRHAIGYNNRQDTFMSLERDDVGLENDFAVVNGNKVYLRVNKETTRIRQMVPGHYVVNGEFYARHSDPEKGYRIGDTSESVKFEIATLNPEYSILFSRTIVLDHPGQQITAFSFDITTDMKVVNFSTEQESFVGVSPRYEPGPGEPAE